MVFYNPYFIQFLLKSESLFFLDSHCIQMVKSGVSEKLIKLLSSHNTKDGDIRLQHALLSALRNLSIAKENKPLIIQQVSDNIDNNY